MKKNMLRYWEIPKFPNIEGDPFEMVRKSCEYAVNAAKDVLIDEAQLQKFALDLDCDAVKGVSKGHLGENLDIGASDFSHADAAVNAAVLGCLLQIGHGFRYELHRNCGRGASRTITIGLRRLMERDLSAAHLIEYGFDEIAETFEVPHDDSLAELIVQLSTLMRGSGEILESMGLTDFAAFGRRVLQTEAARDRPAGAMVRELANTFPGFNDQGFLHDGARVVFLKKAVLAVGELRRLASPYDPIFQMSADAGDAPTPMDNVIPAVLVYHGVLRLSDLLYSTIHLDGKALARGPKEAELRAVSLAACEMIVETAGNKFNPLDLGYYLWLSGKEPAVRAFARHHTKDTIFY